MPKVYNLPTVTRMDNDDYLLVEKSIGGTKKITLRNANNSTFSDLDTTSSVTSIPNSTITTLCSIDIPANTKWIFVANARMGAGGNFTAEWQITDEEGRMSGSVGHAQIAATSALNNVGTTLTRLYSTSSAKTIYLLGWQNSGSAKTIPASSCTLRGFRIQ